jgi:hypothetical protein
MTAAGVANLREFTAGGGTLVAIDRATELPVTAFHLPVRVVTAGLSESDFYVPGSILRVEVDGADEIGYGMPAEAAAFLVRSPAFAPAAHAAGASDHADPLSTSDIRVVARYPAKDLLMSGWVVGERVLAGQAAVLRVRLGAGQVVLLGFRAGHRGQPHGTFKLLFNSLLLGGLAPLPREAAGGPPKKRPDR